MKQVRSNTFETNSSSTHSICMCTKDQYDSWASDWDNLEADSVLYSNCKEKLVTVEEAIKDVNSYREVVKLPMLLMQILPNMMTLSKVCVARAI